MQGPHDKCKEFDQQLLQNKKKYEKEKEKTFDGERETSEELTIQAY